MPEGMIDRGWRIGLWLTYRGLRVWWFVRRPRTQSVHVAVWCHGAILLARNSYRSGYTLPAGGVGRGETVREAALRELREEVGLELPAHRLRPVVELVAHDDYKEDHGAFFEVELEEEPRLEIDRREVTWARFLPREEALARELSPRLRHFLVRYGRS